MVVYFHFNENINEMLNQILLGSVGLCDNKFFYFFIFFVLKANNPFFFACVKSGLGKMHVHVYIVCILCYHVL